MKGWGGVGVGGRGGPAELIGPTLSCGAHSHHPGLPTLKLFTLELANKLYVVTEVRT